MVISCTLLSGCMVGPDYVPPKPPMTTSYTEGKPPLKTVSIPNQPHAGHSQVFHYSQDIPAEWYRLFRSSTLDALIKKGIANSPNLAAAKAALIQAQENYNAQIGSTMLPSINATFTGSRNLFNNTTGAGTTVSNATVFSGGSSIFNLFNTSVNVAYTLDVFGGLRRQIEAVGATVDNQVFQLEAAYLTLSANIVTTAITIASLREQIKATNDLVRELKHQLIIMKNQYKLGGISEITVLTQQTLTSQTEATLAPLKQLLIQNYHLMSVLIGELPSESTLPKFNLNELHLPTQLPISLPSELTRHRPDVKAAEELVHVASAQVGVATANLYPQVTLNASYGWQSTVLSQTFMPAANLWTWGGTITAPLFNGESLMARKRVAIAAYQQAAATYRQTVLQAFQNVADSLRALQHDAQTLKAMRLAEVSAERSLKLSKERYRLGGLDYLSLLIAEQQYQQTRLNRIRAESSRYTDTAALFQALGGGWWNRCSLDCNPILSQNLSQYSLPGKH